jgi:sporulation protein YlmC with PRC-barrel domain
MGRRLSIFAVAILTIFFLATALTQKKSSSATEGAGQEIKSNTPAEGQRINAFMVEKIVGSRVLNMKGERLGVIKDIVIDIDTGRVLYAVVDFGSFLGMGGKLFPVPWQSLAALPSEGIFFLNISKEKLEKAPGYDKNSLPDMGDVHWGTKIAQFYRISREGASGYEYGYGYGYAYIPEMYPTSSRRDPFEKIFDPKSIKRINGQVIKVNRVVPKSGNLLETEIELIVYVGQKDVIPVYLGPVWYVAGPEQKSPFQSGDQVTVTGSWITSEGASPFMIAVEVMKGDETLKLREKDGRALWSAWKRTVNQ